MTVTAAQWSDLEEHVRTAVERALGDAGQQQRAGAAAAQVDAEVKLDKQVQRWRAVVAVVVALATVAIGGVTWVYQRGGAAEAAAHHEQRQDARIDAVAEALERHIAAAATSTDNQRRALRDLGALQIEQGNDARTILLKSAPRAVQVEHEAKPPPLLEAEGRVMRY